MRRTQLYLDDDLWGTLHERARRENTTISELVRKAVRVTYAGDYEQRRAAMEGFIGIRRGRAEDVDAATEVRALRTGRRLERLSER